MAARSLTLSLCNSPFDEELELRLKNIQIIRSRHPLDFEGRRKDAFEQHDDVNACAFNRDGKIDKLVTHHDDPKEDSAPRFFLPLEFETNRSRRTYAELNGNPDKNPLLDDYRPDQGGAFPVGAGIRRRFSGPVPPSKSGDARVSGRNDNNEHIFPDLANCGVRVHDLEHIHGGRDDIRSPEINLLINRTQTSDQFDARTSATGLLIEV